MNILRTTYSATCFLFGLAMLLATFLWKTPPLTFFDSEIGLFGRFAVCFGILIPLIASLNSLGLNDDPECASFEFNKERIYILYKACPLWRNITFGTSIFVGLSVLGVFLGSSINPFYAFYGSVGLVTWVWFTFVVHTAQRLFGSQEAEQDAAANP